MRKQLDRFLGPLIEQINFRIIPVSGEPLELDSFDLSIYNTEDKIIMDGSNAYSKMQWRFEQAAGGWKVTLSINFANPIAIKSITPLQFYFNITEDISVEDFNLWLIPVSGDNVTSTGFMKVQDLYFSDANPFLDKPKKDFYSTGTGIFKNACHKGIYLSALYPLKFNVNCSVVRTTRRQLCFTAVTDFNGNEVKNAWQSEAFWISTNRTMYEAVESLASLYEEKPIKPTDIPVGWNSWDYYFRTVSLDDVIENMEAIRKDPDLSESIKYIVVDDGWSHNWGEWQPNYRFPGGLERLAEEIKSRGFIPGIWTAPLQIEALSYPAMRTPEILIKNQNGDPLPSDAGGHYLVDPTHPAGKKFLQELYTRLYHIGFRLFKIDYLRSLLKVQKFYEKGVGPYDALRELFRIIRDCVKDSHIIGCSLPKECGPFVADSGRISVDIHNHWSHVEWVVDSILHNYWLHNRIWINDPDFLIVRGMDTSTEKETNVMNPNANNPNPVGLAKRWRYGPVFNEIEAKTWTNIVMMTGGSVFLGDRIAMLNEKGLSLVKKALKPTGIAAKPLDLGNDLRPFYWLQDLNDEYRLLIINWNHTPNKMSFDFLHYGLSVPVEIKDVWSKTIYCTSDNQLSLDLGPHESALLAWSKTL
jgi:hypothetical protein